MTCADGFIKVDIYSKDVMLAVCFAIFILQGNFTLINKFVIWIQHWVVLPWDWLTASVDIKLRIKEENRPSWNNVSTLKIILSLLYFIQWDEETSNVWSNKAAFQLTPRQILVVSFKNLKFQVTNSNRYLEPWFMGFSGLLQSGSDVQLTGVMVSSLRNPPIPPPKKPEDKKQHWPCTLPCPHYCSP